MYDVKTAFLDENVKDEDVVYAKLCRQSGALRLWTTT